MGLIRILVIGLIIFLLIQIAKRWLAQNKTRQQQKSDALSEQKMVRCEVCQLHVPESEAIQHQGKFFCSSQHRDQLN